MSQAGPALRETDVLVVGAGPSGLSLAIELGRRGVSVIVIEQNDRVGQNPRAKTVNIRSMEHLRRWGIADAVRAAGPLPAGYEPNVVFATRMFGHKIAQFENALFMSRIRDDRYAESAQWIPQYKFEAVLRDYAATLPTVTLLFRQRFSGATETADGVDTCIIDIATGREYEIRARYLVGADGARSAVRSQIGAIYQGEHGFASVLGLVLRIPRLAALQPHGDALMYWMINADAPALMGPMDAGDLWFWGTPVAKDAVLDDAAIRHRVTASLGRDIPFEVVTKDPWLAHRLIADRYSQGRMLLIGDACHLHPPFGGYGMNLGIADATDVGWKLAAVLQGWGGPTLLDSYEVERRPVHQRTIDEAVENLSFFGAYLKEGKLEEATPAGASERAAMADQLRAVKQREFRGLGMALGMTYHGSPLIASDGTVPPAHDPLTYTPSASPGARAPHIWLDQATSLYDRLGAGFTLLCEEAQRSGETVTALATEAKRIAMPLDVVILNSDQMSAHYAAPFALIRPDQYVAWRGHAPPYSPRRLLEVVRGAANTSQALHEAG
jgi:2-polyprenyl-6-methoxyphenol hydroxylase-like FAD-dependent oxidoreductase